MNIVIGSSIGSATLTYEVIAVFGYLTFGSKVCSFRSPLPNPFLLFNIQVGANIIAMYPSTSLFIAIGQLAIVILVLFSYPLQVHPCRNCLDKVFHAGEAHFEIKPFGDDEEDEDPVDEDHAHAEMTPLKHSVLTGAIIALGFLIAFFVDDLQMGEYISFISIPEFDVDLHSVLSFVGSTGSTTISFILPGLFYWKASIPLLHFARL